MKRIWELPTSPVLIQCVPSSQIPSFVYLALHLRRVVEVIRYLEASSEVLTHSEVVSHFSLASAIYLYKISFLFPLARARLKTCKATDFETYFHGNLRRKGCGLNKPEDFLHKPMSLLITTAKDNATSKLFSFGYVCIFFSSFNCSFKTIL